MGHPFLKLGAEVALAGTVLTGVGIAYTEVTGKLPFQDQLAPIAAIEQLPPKTLPRVASYVCDATQTTCNAGNALATIEGAGYQPITSLDQVSAADIEAIVADENSTFFTDDGVDARSCFRASWDDIKPLFSNLLLARNPLYHWHISQGCSTISMQVAKLVYPQQGTKIDEKLYEMSVALKLNESATPGETQKQIKASILLTYLNAITFNRANYGQMIGIEAASEGYFGIPASEDSITQAATLAALLRHPSADDATTVTNRNNALKLMHADGDIPTHTTAERTTYKGYLAAPLGYIAHPALDAGVIFSQTAIQEQAQFLLMDTITSAIAREGLSPTDPNLITKLGSMGLQIFSTLNPAYQEAAERATSQAQLVSGEGVALYSADTSGGTIAEIGGNYAISQVNLATGEGGSGRPIGSQAKIFEMTKALADGISPDTPIVAPGAYTFPGTTYTVHDSECPPDGTTTCTWSLSNAVIHSSNTAMAKIAYEYDLVPGANKIARELGVTSIPSSADSDDSSVLGTYSATTREMATAFGAIANDGYALTAHNLARIELPNDTITYQFENKSRQGPQIISSANCQALIQTMRGVMEYGTAEETNSIREPNIDIIAKTGTTDNSDDGWLTADTANLEVSTWEGNTSGEVPIAGLQGGGDPARVAVMYINDAPNLPGVPVGSNTGA